MNYLQIFRDKQKIGFTANILSMLVLFFFLLNTKIFSVGRDSFDYFLFSVLLFCIILILISSHLLRNNRIQTKSNIIVKIMALMIAVGVLVVMMLGKAIFHTLAGWISFIFVVADIIITPYSFYLLSRKSNIDNSINQSVDSQNIDSSPIN